jgi:hypothetical protein
MVHLAAAVLAHGAGKPGRGVAVARPQLEDAPRADQPGDLVAIVAGHRPDDGEIMLGGVGFHRHQFLWPRRDQRVEIGLNGMIVKWILGHDVLAKD